MCNQYQPLPSLDISKNNETFKFINNETIKIV